MAEVRLHSRAQEAEADAAAAAEHQRLAADKLAVVQSRLVGSTSNLCMWAPYLSTTVLLHAQLLLLDVMAKA